MVDKAPWTMFLWRSQLCCKDVLHRWDQSQEDGEVLHYPPHKHDDQAVQRKLVERASQKRKRIAVFASGGDLHGMIAAVRFGIFCSRFLHQEGMGYQGMVDSPLRVWGEE